MNLKLKKIKKNLTPRTWKNHPQIGLNSQAIVYDCVLLYWRHLPAQLLYNDFEYPLMSVGLLAIIQDILRLSKYFEHFQNFWMRLNALQIANGLGMFWFFWAFVSLFKGNPYPKMLFQSSHLSWIAGVVDIFGSKLDIYQKTCSESGFWGCQSKPVSGGEGSPYAAKFVQKDNNISLITRVKNFNLFPAPRLSDFEFFKFWKLLSF